jgi:single-strand DNA-binding protein
VFDRLNITVLGNLVNEPAMRVVPGTNDELVSFRVAVDNGYWDRDQKQEVKTGTTFISVTCKGKLGENVLASNYTTGTRLIIPGELTTKEYDRKDGSKGLDVKLKANDVGPSNMWTEVKVPAKDARGGGQPAAQGGDGWQPQYRQSRQNQPQGGGDPWNTRQPPQDDPYGDPWAQG